MWPRIASVSVIPMEVVALRTGPLGHRGAHASRIIQGGQAVSRTCSVPKPIPLNPVTFRHLHRPTSEPIIESSCLHQKCRLPINLRQFLTEQFGGMLNCDSDSILSLAANADPATLSKLARAIRRYSTSRAHQPWAGCSERLARFIRGPWDRGSKRAGLCLKCVCLAFDGQFDDHRGRACLMVDLGPACVAAADDNKEAEDRVIDRIQRQIEEFRTLRSAFALSHYDLDFHASGGGVNFSWHPLG
jgi:hypothetical protein